MNFIGINNIYKKYNTKEVLKDIDFHLDGGMIGLLGNNGAGKTTLMNIITGLIKPTKGKITINSKDINENLIEYKKMIGYLPQEFNLYDELNGYQMLDYIAQLNGILDKKTRQFRILSVLEQTNLKDVCKEKISGYSGGMKRRLGIGIVLVKDPKFIIVDEPTAGLDPLERVNFRNILTLLSETKTILLSTHIVDDISVSCNKIVFLNNKKIEFIGTPEAWENTVSQKVGEIEVTDDATIDYLQRTTQVTSISKQNGNIVIRFIYKDRPDYIDFRERRANLEDAFIYHSKYGKK